MFFSGVNKLPGLVARSIRSRSSRARRKIKGILPSQKQQANSTDLLADNLATVVLAQPPDFSNFKIRTTQDSTKRKNQDPTNPDQDCSKMARDSF